MQPAQVAGAPVLPQVNLLPPHVRARRRVAVARVWLVLAVLVVLLLTSMAAVWTQWQRQAATADLVEVQDTNQALLAQQTQYAEVPQVLRELKARQDARELAMSTEMLWSAYLAALSAVTPLDASIDTISVAQDNVWTGAQNQATGPLSTPGTVGQVSLNGRALTLNGVSDWEDGLAAIPGVVNVEMTSIEVSDDNGNVYYAVGATFAMTPDAFANRFLTEQ